jgi:flagellar hook-associated protein 2
MGIAVDGIVSGLDTTSIIEGLVAAASAPQEVMEGKLEDLEEEQEAVAGLTNRLQTLYDKLQELDSVSEFASLAGTSSDESAVTVGVEGNGVAGRYAIQVNQLAAATTLVSDAFADANSTGVVAEGTLSVTVGSTTTSITIDSTNSSLSDLVAAINDQVDGVTAYIMNTGDATAPYRLVLTGEQTGADNAISLDTSGLTGAGTIPTFTETSTAQDASVTIDGITVTDDDNEIGDAVRGVTFTVSEVTTAAVTVTVAVDADAIVEKVQGFVDAYNDVVDYIATQRAYDVDADIKGPFVGDAMISTVLRQVQAMFSKTFTASSTYTSMSQLGFETQQDGSLEFDSDVFAEVLDAGYDDVVALFTDEDAGFNAAFQELIDGMTDDDTGSLAARADALTDQIEQQEERIADFEERMATYQERLQASFTQMEVALGKLKQSQSALEALLSSSTDDDDD